MSKEMPSESATPSEWEQQRDNLKTMWVTSVLLFWLSAAFQVGLYLVRGEINLILVCVILGMMVLGVALKFRYQRHLASKPMQPDSNIDG